MSARPSPRPTLTDGCLLHPGGGWGRGERGRPSLQGGWEDGGGGGDVEGSVGSQHERDREREKKKRLLEIEADDDARIITCPIWGEKEKGSGLPVFSINSICLSPQMAKVQASLLLHGPLFNFFFF